MAVLFVYVFFQDRTKNNKLLEDNTKMLESLSRSNENIAKALDIISNNLLTLDDKVDRNFERLADINIKQLETLVAVRLESTKHED